MIFALIAIVLGFIFIGWSFAAAMHDDADYLNKATDAHWPWEL